MNGKHGMAGLLEAIRNAFFPKVTVGRDLTGVHVLCDALQIGAADVEALERVAKTCQLFN